MQKLPKWLSDLKSFALYYWYAANTFIDQLISKEKKVPIEDSGEYKDNYGKFQLLFLLIGLAIVIGAVCLFIAFVIEKGIGMYILLGVILMGILFFIFKPKKKKEEAETIVSKKEGKVYLARYLSIMIVGILIWFILLRTPAGSWVTGKFGDGIAFFTKSPHQSKPVEVVFPRLYVDETPNIFARTTLYQYTMTYRTDIFSGYTFAPKKGEKIKLRFEMLHNRTVAWEAWSYYEGDDAVLKIDERIPPPYPDATIGEILVKVVQASSYPAVVYVKKI